MRFLVVLLIFAALSRSAVSDALPDFLTGGSTDAPPVCQSLDPLKSDVPECPPRTGEKVQMIGDNYFPAMAVSVTDDIDSSFMKSFVIKTLQADPEHPPQFLIHAGMLSMRQLRVKIAKLAPDAATRDRWLASLTSVGGSSENWQQDIFQGEINADTGRPVLREMEVKRWQKQRSFTNWLSTPGGSELFDGLADAASNACAISKGKLFKYQKPLNMGQMGGNLEATASGLCLVGTDAFQDNQWGIFSADACGNSSHALKVPTSFLATGHVDEVIATIRTPNKAAPCDDAVLVASPAAALSALAKDRSGLFVSGPDMTDRQRRGRYEDYAPFMNICREVIRAKRAAEPAASPENRAQGAKKVTSFESLVLSQAWADDANSASSSDCAKLTNGDVLDYWKTNPDIALANNTVQKQLEDFKTDLASRLKKLRPQCDPQIIDVPDLFSGKTKSENGSVYFKPASARSIFPNPTNGVQFAKTMILPEQGNLALRGDLEARLTSLGLVSQPIDSFELHKAFGNIHCSTNAIRYCRPVAATAAQPPRPLSNIVPVTAPTTTRTRR